LVKPTVTYGCVGKRHAELFTSKYVQHKASRKIEWQHKMGIVELALELDGKTVPFVVSPAQAAVVALFEQNGTRRRLDCL